MNKIALELTTPERIVSRIEADEVTLPTQEGEITILPGHVPLVGVLVSGMMTIRAGGEESYVAVSGGFIEIQPGSKVIILADTAERAEELDLKKVEEARERAQKMLREQRGADDVSAAAMMAELNRELARLKVARRHGARTAPRNPPGSA